MRAGNYYQNYREVKLLVVHYLFISYSKEKGLLFWTNIGMTYKASFI